MKNTVFITGTDTDIGKTFVSCLILRAFNAAGFKTFGIKPLASGCEKNSTGELRSQDALHLQYHASIKKPYDTINPIAFEKPVAPHIAASESGITIPRAHVYQNIIDSIQSEADINLIEGVGGWAVPLNDTMLFSDVIIELQIPIILVVGIKLGCLNHALLTYQNIVGKGGFLIGWIANCVDPKTLSIKQNIETLRNWIDAPCLGVVPYACQSESDIDIEIIQEHLFEQSCITGREC